MKQRILLLLRFYVLSIAFFIVAKVVFLLANHSSHPFGFTDVYDVLRNGLTLDLSTSLYFLVVPYVLTVISIWYSGKVIRWAYYSWAVITSVTFALAFAADTALYPHWGFKLDASCLQYLASPAEAAASVPTWQLIIGFIVLVALMGLMGWTYIKTYKPLKPLKRKWAYGVFSIVALPLIFIGIRGGVDESTTNIGQVYYSQNPFLNHSAVNPVFSFLSSFERSVRNDVRYHFIDDEACDSLVTTLYDTRSVHSDTLLRSQRPNIVLVMLESVGGAFMKIGGRNHVMPRLNAFCDEGVFFSECYANSFRTDRGTVCTWSGYLSFPTMSVMKSPAKSASLPGIARTLADEGYDTHYVYGGDINFTNMRSYLVNVGFHRLTSKSDFSLAEQRTSKWGVRDDITFNRVIQEVKKWDKTSKKPHLIGYSTLSSHQPWDVPTQVLDDPVENAFYYLDQCIGTFIDTLRNTPQWDNLLLVFVPDHGIGYYGLGETDPLQMHIPVLWMGGAVKEPRIIDVICNQTDQAATLLGQLGLSHDDFRFSRDVMSETYTQPFAYHTFNNGFSLVDSTRFVAYDLNANSVIAGDAPDLVERGKAILQFSSEDLSKR